MRVNLLIPNFTLLICLLGATAAAAPTPVSTATRPWEGIAEASVELHAHLFMKEGMGPAFRGGFNGKLAAEEWTDKFSSQANPESVESSGIRILVACLYAHPLLSSGLKGSIRRQLAQAQAFVISHPGWVIARDAAAARQALGEGKRVMILSLEGVDGVLDDENDLAEFVDQGGIRIVNLLHLTDDELGGVALMGGIKRLFSPDAWISQLFSPHHDDGVRTNRLGLTERGRGMARALLRRGVWLDLTHSSDASQRELLPLLEEAGQPPLYTHTVLRRYHREERAISDWQLEEVRKHGGIVGLMPSEDMLDGTPAACAPGCTAPCQGGVGALVTQYKEVSARIGAASTVLGSDYNGGIRHLKPSCGTGTGTELDRKGLWNIGQVGSLWKALRTAGAPVPEHLGVTVTRFLEAWDRVKRN